MAELTRDDLIEAAKGAVGDGSRRLSRLDFERITGIGQYHIYRLFPGGGWSELKRLAGIGRHPRDNQTLADTDLLEEFHSVAAMLGRMPTWALFGHHAGIFADVVRRRFGGVQGTLKRWQRVRIEFEFRSRTFRDHGHDPAGGDLIVCWEHNWLGCPLEVVKLLKVISELER